MRRAVCAGRRIWRGTAARAGTPGFSSAGASSGCPRTVFGPKIMTALTAILGLLPLLVLNLHGTEIERPLAIVMIGGLLTSTAFTLLALPTFYSLVHHIRERRRA